MRKSQIGTITFAAILLAFAACKPEHEVQPAEYIVPTAEPPLQLPAVDNVYGAMYSLKLVKVENGVVTKSEIASAEFYDSPSNTATAGEKAYAGYVAVNNFILNQEENNGYEREATEGHIFEHLNFDQGVTWYVQGDDGIPSVTFSWSSTFPEYVGGFPAEIVRSNGFVLTLGNNNVQFADSVFVALAAGDKLIVKRCAGDANEVRITAQELSSLQVCPAASPAYLQISASVDDIFELAGRPTALVKQTTEVHTVVIR